METTDLLYLLESLKLGSGYTPEALEKQARNRQVQQEIIREYEKEIREREDD